MHAAVASMDRPPGRLARAALRLPTWLYRAHFGWLLGDRFLCVTHRGRKSGKLRRTVVEVVRFDQEALEAVVVAGWGPRTQWYRNLEVAPAVEVRIGPRRWRRPAQRLLDEEERAEVLGEYEREHPRAAKELARVLGGSGVDDAGLREMAERLRAVAFSPARATA